MQALCLITLRRCSFTTLFFLCVFFCCYGKSGNRLVVLLENWVCTLSLSLGLSLSLTLFSLSLSPPPHTHTSSLDPLSSNFCHWKAEMAFLRAVTTRIVSSPSFSFIFTSQEAAHHFLSSWATRKARQMGVGTGQGSQWGKVLPFKNKVYVSRYMRLYKNLELFFLFSFSFLFSAGSSFADFCQESAGSWRKMRLVFPMRC